MDASPELFVTLPAGDRRQVRICYQTFGDPSDPAVVFISGHAGSMLEWHEDLLPLFSPAGDGHYLIRFDHRDTGLSTEFPVPGGYTLSDMAGDVEGLVDHLGLSSKGFHLVAASMGGPIGYMVAARRPQQTRSLTLLYTSPGVSAELPPSERASSLDVGTQPAPGGTGNERKLYIEYRMRLYNAFSTQPPDEEEKKEAEIITARITDRDMQGGTLYSKGPNHSAACFGHWPGVEVLKDVRCSTTVIQSAKDQVFGEVHGEALAKAIQGADYVLWEDVGHELPKRIWSRMAEVFLRTWKRGDDQWAKDSGSKE